MSEKAEQAEKVAEEIRPQLDRIVGQVADFLEASKEFAVEQAPLFVQEVLHFKAVESGIWFAVWFALFAVSTSLAIWGLIRFWRWWATLDDREKRNQSEAIPVVHIFGFLAYALVGIGPFVLALGHLTTFLKIWIAPRLYLLEYFRSLL